MSLHLHPNLKLRRRTEVHFVNEIAGLTGSSRQTCPARHAQPVSSCYGYNLLAVCMYVDFYISAVSAWTLTLSMTTQGYLGPVLGSISRDNRVLTIVTVADL
jgi:hypothetical protein